MHKPKIPVKIKTKSAESFFFSRRIRANEIIIKIVGMTRGFVKRL